MKIKVLFMTLTLILAVLISGCKKNDYQATPGVCPVVVSTDPYDGEAGVPLSQVVSATFNEKMNAATITSTTFTVIDATKSAELKAAVVITGTLSYSGMTSSFTPSSPLAPNTTYTARMTTAARDLAGNALQADKVWTFKTDLPPIVTTDPADNETGIFPNKVIVATFSVPVDSFTLKSAVTNFTIKQGTTTVPGKVSYSSDEKTASFTPTSPLAPFTVYNGTIIAAGVKNKFGTLMAADYVWKFTTIPQLTLSSNPLIGGTTSGAGLVFLGSSVTAVAKANAGFTFINWTENGAPVPDAPATYVFTISGNRTLVANFTATLYTVSVSSNPSAGGTTTVIGGTTPSSGTFDSGKSVTVKAVPTTGLFTFTNWTENGIIVPAALAEYTFIISGSRTLVANYTAIPYTVSVSSNPLLGGTTTVLLGTTPSSGTFNSGTSVTVKADPKPDFTFTNWTDGLTGIIVPLAPAEYTFIILGSRTLIANYTATPYTVSVSSNPLLGGTTTVLGGTTPTSGTFDSGKSVTVKAVPTTGLFTFTNWTENGNIVTGAPADYTFIIRGSRTLVANYTAIPYTVSVSSNPLLGGTTTVLLGTTPSSGTFNSGTSVTVKAVPTTGLFTFTNWTDGVTGTIITGAPAEYTFIIRGSRTLVANYTAIPYTVSVSSNPSEGGTTTVIGGTTSSSGTFDSGTLVTVNAVHSTGFTFTNWTEGGNVVFGESSYQFTITGPRILVANYTAISLTPLFTTGFGVFGGSAGMTNMGDNTIINGDIGTTATGTSSITGFHDSNGDIYTETCPTMGAALGCGLVTGKIYTCTNSTTGPTSAVNIAPNTANPVSCGLATVGRGEILAAYNTLVAKPVSGVLLPENLSGKTVYAGVYKAPSGSFMIQDGLSGSAGDLTLSGTATDVFVFQMATTLTVGGPGAAFPRSVKLIGGALAKNVYWQVGSFATINAAGGGTMEGTIISQEGAAFGTAPPGPRPTIILNGRVLSLGASVTLVNTVINLP